MAGKFTRVLLGLMLLCGGLAQAAGFDVETKSVWPEGLADEMNTLVAFRAQIAAPADATEAWLDLVAWYSYRVTLNGQFVAFGPARGPKGLFRPDAWKLPLRSGVNDLQVEVTGYNCRNFYLMKQPPFFKAQVRVGDRILARSGRDFRAFRLPRVQKVPRYSYQRTFSEAYRLPGREEGPLALAAAPEPKLIDRVAPEPEFEYRADLPPIAFSRVFVDEGFKVHDDRSLSFPGMRPDFDGFPKDALDVNTAYLAQRLSYREGRAATDAEKGRPAFEMKAGDSIRFDLGKNDTGFPGTTVTVAKPGRIVFTFDEILLRGEVHGCERYHFDCANIIVWDVTEPGEYRLDAFEPYTMRYLEIGVLSGEMRIARPHFRSYKNSTAKRASFRASDPALEKIFDAAKETMMQNAVDVFMDCPSRERAGWNCDAYFTAPAATLLTGSTALERVFEENQALPTAFENIPKGMFPMCYPSDHTKDSYIPNWAMWFVLQSEEYLRRSGDRATIDALRPKIEAFVRFLQSFRNADGLLEKLPSWVFVEWSKANSFVQDVNYPSNMTWSQVLDAVARLYGRKDLAEEAACVREKIREQSWNGQFFRDHAVRGDDGKLVVKESDITETCQYYAFFSGVATKETHPRLWQALLKEFGPSRDAKKMHPEVFPAAPFIGDYLRLKILERENLGQQILDETKEYFLGMAEKTGTLWEHADTQASCNHGFASYVAVLLAHSVLGIERIDLQNKRLVLAKDVSAKLDWVEGIFPVGTERIRVRREGTKYETDVPKGWTVETLKAPSLSFKGYTNKNPLLYSCGEEMRFYVSLVDTADGNRPVKGRKLVWTRCGDDGVMTNGVAMSDEPLEIKTKTDKPGFVRITVNVLDENGKKVREAETNRDVCWDGGAGADVNRIEAWPIPADFDAFWDARLAALAKAPCAATLTELTPQTDKVYFAKFLVPVPGEAMPAQGLIAWPRDAKDGTLPLDVAVTGYGFGKTVFDERSALAGKGRICVSITRQGEDPRREPGYYENIRTNVCKNYCFRNTDRRPEDTDQFKMLMRDALALRWAKTLPQWNGRDIKTHGGSMGGYQAIGLAALDPQVSEVVAEVPWSADFAGAMKFKRMGGWTPGWTRALDYLALASLAKRVTCPVTMSIGLGDYVCPPSGEMLLFNALKGRKSLKATQNRGHGGIPYGPEAPSYAFENKIAVLPDLPRKLKVEVDGRPVRVEEARCSKFPLNQVWPGFQRPMDQTEIDYFVNFDLARPGTLTVTVPGLNGAEVLMRPMSESSRCSVKGDVVTVALAKPEQFTLEFGPRGKAKSFPMLHVFVNPPFAYEHVKDEIYFGPGEHHVGLVQPKSGQTVCLAPGAVVYGSLFLCGVRDVRVVGRGIFDGSYVERCDPESAVCKAAIACGIPQETTADTVCNSFTAYAVTNVFVEGVTFRDSGSWTVKIRACSRDVTLDNVKIIGQWRYNTDGINICASERVTVRNSFVRSYDDCFVARGAMLPGDNLHPVRDVLVENCVAWCDWGKSFEVWAGKDPCLIERVRFRNNKVIAMAALACDVTTWFGSKSNVIRDIVFEDLEIDLPGPRYGQEILNRSFSSAFKGSPYSSDHIITIDCDRLGDVVAEQAVAEATEFSKYNLDYSGIMLRNVKIVGQPAGTRTTAKVLTKYPCHKIRNVTFEKVPEMEIQSGGALENFKVNGRRVK